MESPWYSLMTNVAVVAFFISVWTQARDVFERWGPRAVEAGFGATMGLGAITTMVLPVQFGPGLFFDLRTCLIALAAFFGGPLAALIALLPPLAYRLWLGGIGAPAGVLAITLAALFATFGHLLLRSRRAAATRRHYVALALVICCVGVLAFLVNPVSVRGDDWLPLLAARIVLLFVTVLLSSLALAHDQELHAVRRDNQTYRKVLDGLPDGISVTSPDGRFIIANPAAARLHGFASPADLLGRADLTGSHLPPAPAGPGESHVEFEHTVQRTDGSIGWLQTVELQLNDDLGRPIGRITHNRDITSQKHLELELDERQRVLSFALAQMSDGVAMFDRSGRLLFCNARYQQLFPLTSDVRVPGAQLRTILAAAVARREQQVGASPSEIVNWIDEVAGSLNRESEEEVHLFDGSWLRVSTRPSPDGVSMVVVSDITRLKQTELELLDVTEQLRQEATTDPLTGLVNRRALDQRLEVEIARSLRANTPISVILLDIDHFKAYNDTYGHQAGDACLQAVSESLGNTFRRPADLVARYGGEEFLVLLPDVDSDAAGILADAYRDALAALGLPHEASPLGRLTASLGIASYGSSEIDRSAADLVGRADEALYAAKSAGRDRVSTWRRHFRPLLRSVRVLH